MAVLDTDDAIESRLDPLGAFLWRHRYKEPLIAMAFACAAMLALVAYKLATDGAPMPWLNPQM